MSSRCRAAALRFLKIRPRSVQEMRDKLLKKDYSTLEVDAEIEYLKSIELLDDRAFSASWIRYRLARPFGFRRIITELRAKGIAEDIIVQSVALAKGDYNEQETIEDVASRRLERLGGIEPLKRKKRVSDYLLRRGFSMDAVIKVIKKLC